MGTSHRGRGNVAGVNQTQAKATQTMERKRRKEGKRSLWQKDILVQKPRLGERSENKRCPRKIRMTIDQRNIVATSRRRTRGVKINYSMLEGSDDSDEPK